MFVNSRRDFLRQVLASGAFVGASRLALHGQSPDPTIRDFVLTAREADVAVAPGRSWRTWTYNGQFPGPLIRVRQGERLRLRLVNELPDPTTIHWHGIPVPNPMDGVSGLTQEPAPPGGSFLYDFVADTPGTYLYHSHHGLQMDRGLVGPLIVDPVDTNHEPAFDREYILVLDDWLATSPETAFAQLRRAGGMMGGMGAGMMNRSDGPTYGGFLVNGAITAGSTPLRVRHRERVRIRVINGASSTTFRVGLQGHRLVVTHSDGQSIQPVTVDTLTIGMGERYDVVVSADSPGTYPLLVGPVDSSVPGVVVPFVYDGYSDRLVAPTVWPSTLLRGRSLRLQDLAALTVRENVAIPNRVIRLQLGQAMMGGYAWTINGQAYPNADPILVAEGDHVRFAIMNATMMRHPMHLHGHFFRVRGTVGGDRYAPLKDTVLVEPMGTTVEIDALMDNPGKWFLHCHHLYHMEAGMARVVEYR
jgi:FtsP/CotA-like multicopper oxidase with cupredoxin domain